MRWRKQVSISTFLKNEIPILLIFILCIILVEFVADYVSLSGKSDFFVIYYQRDTIISKWHIIAFIYFIRLGYIVFRYRQKRVRYLKAIQDNCLRKRYVNN